MSRPFDVIVVGGGVVGLTTALLLESATAGKYQIGIVEASPPKNPGMQRSPLPPVGLRVSALSPASVSILKSIDVWQQVAAERVAPYTGMCVWQADQSFDSDRGLTFSAAGLGLRELGFIVENDLLRNALWAAAERAEGICLLPPASPQAVEIDDGGASLSLSDGSSIRAKLLVAADGAHSALRQLLNVSSTETSYGQRGIVAHIATEKPHQSIAWQRFLPAGPVALLPLADGRCSLVWSCGNRQADELLALDDDAFSKRLTEASEGVLGHLQCVSQRAAFPLSHAHAVNYVGSRFALVGDAAHRIHPLAGQGVNLGLLDAAALAETLAHHHNEPFADPGDVLVLRRYARWRRRDNELTLGMMNLLHRIFAGNSEGSGTQLAKFAGRGLGLLNRIEPLKRSFAEHAIGRGSDLPAAARWQ